MMERKTDMTDFEMQLWYEANRKSGWLAAGLNLVLPGAGYMYCGRFVLAFVVFFWVLGPLLYATFSAPLMIVGALLWALLWWAVMFVDGFLCAARFNRLLLADRLLDRRRHVDNDDLRQGFIPPRRR